MKRYDVTIKTSAIENSGTKAPIYIQLVGDLKTSPKKLLSDRGFDTSSLDNVLIITIDIGNLYGVNLSIDGYDDYRPEELIIKYDSYNGKQDRIFKNKDNVVISSTESFISFRLVKPNSNSNNLTDYSDNNNNVDSQNILNTKDLSSIKKISCTETVKDNPIFGPNYVTNNVNYSMHLIECPYNCMKLQSKIYGIGIHPEESPICLSAIVDKVLPFYGGLITVNINKGLNSYYSGEKIIYNIRVDSFNESKRSFTVSKVDNSDMITQDIRIMSYDGKPTYKGRLEIRKNGEWGTICNLGMDQSAAKVVCKQMGYKDGLFHAIDIEHSKGFCLNFLGSDYCGNKSSQIYFSNLSCEENHVSISNCYKQLADLKICNHEYDTIIECNNTEITEDIIFTPHTIRLVDSNNHPSETGIGRVEVLYGNWSSLCNKKFTEESAKVICKQMGYLDGKLYGSSDSDTMCKDVLGNDLCGNISQMILYTEIKCSGNEKSIKDCNTNENTASCNHFNDVILKCDGYGDPSGKSQNIKQPVVLRPVVEKLAMLPTKNLTCSSSLKDKYFRGDPGSMFMVNCPSNCNYSVSISITGTGIYTYDSSICLAALHSGILAKGGGDVLVNKTYGQNRYYGSTFRGISSLDSQQSLISFFLSIPTSAHYNLVSLINNYNNFDSLYYSFLEMSSDIENQYGNLSLNGKHTNGISGIDIENNNKKPAKAIYSWKSPNNIFIFDGSNSIDLINDKTNTLVLKILELKTFTIIINLELNNFDGNKIQTILSIGGCDGLSISINEDDELIVNIKCGTSIFKSGIYIPLNTSIIIFIVYDGEKIIFYYNNQISYEVYTLFNLKFKEMIRIGRNSEYNEEYFFGKIKEIAFFSEPMNKFLIEKVYNEGYDNTANNSQIMSFTTDKRRCLSSCSNKPIPGSPGSPEPIPEALVYYVNGVLTSLPGNSIALSNIDDNNNNSINKNLYNSNESDNDLLPLTEVTCKTTGNEVIEGNLIPNITKRVKCPKNCYLEYAPLFGTLIYTIDSSVCLAAIHTGIVKGKSEYILLMTTGNIITSYTGTNQYGKSSASIDKSSLSFTFKLAPKTNKIKCLTLANEKQFAGVIGTKYTVICPLNCSKGSSLLYGGKEPYNNYIDNTVQNIRDNSQKIKDNLKNNLKSLYSGDSSICQSAIHAGILNDKGGEVQFSIEEGLKHYYGSRAYGVQSKSRDYYVKSIMFYTSLNILSAYYKEDFKLSILASKYDIIDDLEASFYPSKWEYSQEENLNNNIYISSNSSTFGLSYSKSISSSKTISVIKQTSNIISRGILKLSSILLVKKIEVVNVVFKINLYFINMNTAGIVFRYKDFNNYYHLRLNNLDTEDKVIICKISDGNTSVIAKTELMIIPKTWYEFNIYQYYDNFKITVRIGNIKNVLNVAEIIDNDHQRGKLGVATQGNNEIYVSNIQVEPYDPDYNFNSNYIISGSDYSTTDNNNSIGYEYLKKKTGRNFNNIIKENTKLHRDKQCKHKYTEDLNKRTECREFHNYCKIQCNSIVFRRENILNFICYNKCIKDYYLKLKINNMQDNAVFAERDNSIWIPKEGEKCDFKPDDEGISYWIPCFIQQVKVNENDPEQKFVQLKYLSEKNSKNQETIINLLYPNQTLKRCGEILNIRKDCLNSKIQIPNLNSKFN